MSATLCLCMIVKNEAGIIERCLGSVRPLLSTWVIVDTGSTDGTHHTGRHAEAARIARGLLARGELPSGERPRIERILALSRQAAGAS